MVDDDDGESRLFGSLLRACASAEQNGELKTINETVSRELDEWWSCGPFGAPVAELQHHQYGRFYSTLVDAVRKAELLPASRDELVDVNTWMDLDWGHDQRVLLQENSGEAFTASMLVIALGSSRPHEETNHAQLLSSVRKLRELCSVVESAAQPIPSSRPQTMTEKLARMRSRRSTLVKDSSAARLELELPSSSDTAKPADESSSLIDNTPASNLSEHSSIREDDAAHYFTIETRLELKEKLVALQARLDSLLLQTKLAWMKCFSSTDENADAMENEVGVENATRIVEKGEALASHLLDAFQKARLAACPINEYKALVTTCELEFEAFEALVGSLAIAPSPVRTKKKEPSLKSVEELQEVQRAEPGFKSTPISFDFPSMKTYYEKAAPSYAAYLPSKKR